MPEVRLLLHEKKDVIIMDSSMYAIGTVMPMIGVGFLFAGIMIAFFEARFERHKKLVKVTYCGTSYHTEDGVETEVLECMVDGDVKHVYNLSTGDMDAVRAKYRPGDEVEAYIYKGRFLYEVRSVEYPPVSQMVWAAVFGLLGAGIAALGLIICVSSM